MPDAEQWSDVLEGDVLQRNAELRERARALRKNQTKEEHLLWNAFLRTYPLRFRRQYIIGNYIADFYCHHAGLVVELDGSQHYEPENVKKDLIRTKYLESQRLQILRFNNLDVDRQFLNVCQEIDRVVKIRMGQNV